MENLNSEFSLICFKATRIALHHSVQNNIVGALLLIGCRCLPLPHTDPRVEKNSMKLEVLTEVTSTHWHHYLKHCPCLIYASTIGCVCVFIQHTLCVHPVYTHTIQTMSSIFQVSDSWFQWKEILMLHYIFNSMHQTLVQYSPPPFLFPHVNALMNKAWRRRKWLSQFSVNELDSSV